MQRRLPALVAALCLASAIPGAAGSTPANPPEFDRDVAPVLARRCLQCHSGADPKGKLDLSRREAVLRGGEGGPAVVAGKADESPLVEQVEGEAMPPKSPLPAAERRLLRAWVESGARWGTDPIDPLRASTDRRAGRDWWSLQPVSRPTPPGTRRPAPHPIDAFVLHRLEASDLGYEPRADRRTLIRRLAFDLTGLPPTPGEVAAFEADARPDAYERLVDRLLASPRHGVRWARPWLDLARYGESNGFEFDEFRPNAWRYRDWVVDALNRDVPYDEFIRLQVAGDVLRPDDPSAIEATGFLVAGAFDTPGQNQQSEAMRRVVRQDELEDVVGTVGQAFLGITVQCARCHDHKFDPVTATDYYRLSSALSGVRHGERDLGPLEPTPAGKSRRAYAVSPREPEVTRLLARGNPATPRQPVTPGGVACLAGFPADFGLPADAKESERRARLAAWLTDPRNPLTPRVIVNRLWQAHFGTGLVETPSDLGFNGGRPSHPELLDWLASELVARGWSLKAMHRLIVTSEAYRQGSRPDPAGLRADAGDRLLWRKAPMRLEAEMVRDAMLAVSGALNERQGGPGYAEFAASQAPGTPAVLYTPVEPSGPDFDRRTLYRTWARGGRNGFLDAFDCPDPSTSTPRRPSTTTPLQALALLNDALTLRLADRMADRLRREAGAEPARQVELAYRLAFGRPPSGDERARAARIVERHGPAVLARAIFNSNEFLYVD
ncbi:Planctomycete cytochrome C [Aquisphaera giovannonii]|uniref:Planctomycete cytochrome C n=1 Tax=Aquisphaera giovannonii TaxID=406548 RepID=A0A5B9WD78_9BACT|nr:PSD1 and planctomycete cytochrome C domain-containing protein [Aquisphaera giovannonii]QEH38566.1 Planctomycete cytochrome C [Aquisphaera giovannonii]